MRTGWFTPRSARRAARRLEPLARDVCRAYRRLSASSTLRLAEGRVDAAYYTAICRFHVVALRLAREGVLFRDLGRGWFEFPARRAGREVRLAWRVELDETCPCDDTVEAP